MESSKSIENHNYFRNELLEKYSYITIYFKEHFYKITFFLILFYIRYIHRVKEKIYVDSDNRFNTIIYENNTDFSEYLNSSDVKVIAFYYPIFQSINNEDNFINEWENIKNTSPIYKGHHQPRIPEKKELNLSYYDCTDPEVIKKQIKLAKSHGIYGFGIYFYWFSGKILFQKTINLFLEDKDINFPFFLVWKNENFEIKSNNLTELITIEQEYRDNDPEKFINDIKKFLISEKYIKINKKPVLGIYNPFDFTDLKKLLRKLRAKAKELGIGEIFLMAALSKPKINEINLFDAAYEIPPHHFFKFKLMQYKNYYYYSGLIYRRKNGFEKKRINDFPIYRCNMLEYDNSPHVNKSLIFEDFSPEKFYMANKLIVNWTRNNFDESNRFIFINGWNDWGEGSYLEPDENFGFASINALSKALFDIPFTNKMKYNLDDLQKIPKIAIQVHLYYPDLVEDVVKYTNNIPAKFDLFITTNTAKKKKIIEEYISKNTKATNYIIEVAFNKGRDILPMLTQMRDKIRNYKYFCHIHTKKSKTAPQVGENWRNYLYKNLLGSEKIVSEILTNFENYDKLGVVYPENFYEVIELSFGLSDTTIGYMNYILKKLFPGYQTGKILNFPAGDMFWARVDAIYQVFERKFDKKFSSEAAQVGDTIAHGIERIWIYVAKLNNYYFKTTFYDI